MDKEKLTRHIQLCRRNLLNARVKCCAACPFEEEIIREYPTFRKLFTLKRRNLP